jgi:hypothetical protein
MRRLGRPILTLALSANERGALESWARRPKTAQATALRARLILGRAAGKTNTEGGAGVPRHQANRGQVAESFRREAARRLAR